MPRKRSCPAPAGVAVRRSRALPTAVCAPDAPSIEPASDTSARVGVDTCCTPELKVLFDPNSAISAPPPIAASAPITSSRLPSTNSTTRLAMAPPPSAPQTLTEQPSGPEAAVAWGRLRQGRPGSGMISNYAAGRDTRRSARHVEDYLTPDLALRGVKTGRYGRQARADSASWGRKHETTGIRGAAGRGDLARHLRRDGPARRR